MTINRELWIPPFNFDALPHWTCPVCRSGYLLLSEENKTSTETLTSQKAREENKLDPTEADILYTAVFTCSNLICQDIVVSCGTADYSDEYYLDENYEPEFAETVHRFTPHYFLPALNIFQIPLWCSDKVGASIQRSFNLYFCDPSSAANHVRQSIENLFRDEWCELYDPEYGEKIKLHRKILDYRKKNQEIADKLLAIKWIGNVGSHDDVSMDDVLDSYVILESVLDDIFVGSDQEMKNLVEKINKGKGPVDRSRTTPHKPDTAAP